MQRKLADHQKDSRRGDECGSGKVVLLRELNNITNRQKTLWASLQKTVKGLPTCHRAYCKDLIRLGTSWMTRDLTRGWGMSPAELYETYSIKT
jgi:hypothetical protein